MHTTRPLTDARKTIGAIAVLALALQRLPATTDTLVALDHEAKSRVGPGWTFVTALQWLTGSKAESVIDHLADHGTIGGLTKQQHGDLMRMARRVCADGYAGGDAELLLHALWLDQEDSDVREFPACRLSNDRGDVRCVGAGC
ncbi:hypothetical protein [Chitinivorax sp. B]|uniref:hypothetical protein n=1 Tax=Chitinivorax sp. B TaxID=2502235 RepID=UPI0010F978F7|nr:hypothetical protein [Chitinivorax sp. B]